MSDLWPPSHSEQHSHNNCDDDDDVTVSFFLSYELFKFARYKQRPIAKLRDRIGRKKQIIHARAYHHSPFFSIVLEGSQ